ncbi:Major Facilitator Superfamily protein [Bacillus sp. OV194]|nr:Major Facilitator Superfamily protein [Bacillus sp. OV194]
MPRPLWLLVIGMVLNVTGASFLWPVNTIYIHEHLDKSLTVAGIVLMCNSGAGVLGNLAGGLVFDRLGGYRAILTGVSVTLAALIMLVFYHDFMFYASLLAVIGFGMGITFPSMYAMAGTVWKEGGRKAFNAIYVAQNVGVAAGAACGGLVASYSFQWSFIGNALLCALFFLLVLFGYKGISNKASEISPETILTQDSKIKNKTIFTGLLILCGGYLLAWISYVQWQSTIAVFTQEAGISLKLYSLLWTVNGALIVLLQPVLAYILRRGG